VGKKRASDNWEEGEDRGRRERRKTRTAAEQFPAWGGKEKKKEEDAGGMGKYY